MHPGKTFVSPGEQAAFVREWVQDRTGFVVWLMNMKGSDKFAKPPMAPWSIIVTDNILHILWIAWVVSLV